MGKVRVRVRVRVRARARARVRVRMRVRVRVRVRARVRVRRAVELLHLPADEAAEEQDGVELEQLLHVEQLAHLVTGKG